MWKFLLFTVCAFAFNAKASISPLMESANLEADIRMGKLAVRSEKALEMALKVAAAELTKRGHSRDAQVMMFEWTNQYRYTFQNFTDHMKDRDIGDHAALSQWIKEKYDMIEAVLGVNVCKTTHLSDIKTLNFTIPIVFRPCSFPMDGVSIPKKSEYILHFNEGDVYYGLFPVVAYWTVYAACGGATAGTGFVYFCGMIGSIGERACTLVGDDLGGWIYSSLCESNASTE